MPKTYTSLSAEELDAEKLTPLVKLRSNNALKEVMADLADVVQVSKAFVEFQRY